MYKKLIVFFIFLMLFGEAYGETLIGSTYRYVFVVLIIVLLCSYLFISGGVQINPLDKIVELYERLLQSEREKIELLKNANK